jgi:flagellar hook-associated protein 3 FlgL
MRVASTTIYEMVKFNLGNITEELNKASNVVSTGKRINNLSDDPVGLNQALIIKSTLANIEQMDRNIAFGKTWLVASESAMNHVQDLISDTKSLCIQMATATTSSDARNSAAKTVQNTIDEMVSLANTELNGRYIFAGSKTESAPFSQSGVYSGDSNPFTINIGRNSTVQVGSDGEAVFGTAGQDNDIFKTLEDLKTALTDDNVSGIQNAMTRLDNHFDHISTKISDLGSKMIRMEIKGNILQGMDIANTERLSNIEDADIAEAIIELKQKELAYQAALASSAKVMKLSLIDYL